ncbi:hypothetical protein BgAZ_107720 [Babesia gibsoni]|uniref:Uncharacterized protein n=1 Tax=Babesia gibsoni TaxID=33632 RepID=A0AAD8UTT9_BABGI|nr:hypothetical protein BgAZ_107720 [Babesia gibsoni]
MMWKLLAFFVISTSFADPAMEPLLNYLGEFGVREAMILREMEIYSKNPDAVTPINETSLAKTLFDPAAGDGYATAAWVVQGESVKRISQVKHKRPRVLNALLKMEQGLKPLPFKLSDLSDDKYFL